jgi:hypothetical protein
MDRDPERRSGIMLIYNVKATNLSQSRVVEAASKSQSNEIELTGRLPRWQRVKYIPKVSRDVCLDVENTASGKEQDCGLFAASTTRS